MAVSVLSLIKNFILCILYFKVKHITEKSVHTHITANRTTKTDKWETSEKETSKYDNRGKLLSTTYT